MAIENRRPQVTEKPGECLPEVSVCTTVFNAQRYIAQTIESVLNQKVSFPIEFVISDDCSTDSSAEIIKGYAKRFPKIIRFYRNERNLGLNANFMAAMRSCRGKYIALLDGDDYWVDPGKLQTQRDFLISHPECVLCGTATEVLDERTGELRRWPTDEPENTGSVKFFSTPEMYKLNLFWIPTHTVLLRAEFVDFPPWFKDVVYVDRALRLILSLHGRIAFINRTTGVYRIHNSNVSASQYSSPKVARGYLHTYRNFYHYSGRKFYREARFAINHSLNEERVRIMKSMHGFSKVSFLLKNTLSAFSHFRILQLSDVVRFPYQFLFIKDFLMALKTLQRSASFHHKLR